VTDTDPEDPALRRFLELLPFPLDSFQLRACAALLRGAGVLVAAPTGAGKTVVGEFAVHLAVERDSKCFYTTPIKALSNQKFQDLVQRYGPDRVGLLTGDNSINSEAPVVVMTTEVLRNMIYAESRTLQGLDFVVMDEVHYLADRDRGAVWEEVIINLPEHVAVVALSATVSNAEEFGAWLAQVRGSTEVVVEEHRPVPLLQHVVADGALMDLFASSRSRSVNSELIRLARRSRASVRNAGGARKGAGRARRGAQEGHRSPRTSRPEVLRILQEADLLPCICFIFSRAGCAAAVEQFLRSGLTLTTPSERSAIRELVRHRVAGLDSRDLEVLGHAGWLEGLERGVAAHHAGMIPIFKEAVEELFRAGLVKVVYATETLALGINMPARAVVLERLVKWNGRSHERITAGEYTQLTGRAGRRGIDVQGHAVVIWHAGLDPNDLAGLASARTYPLISSFRPSYNMAVNLVGQLGRRAAREVLETSLAQFQADRRRPGRSQRRSIAKQFDRVCGLLAELDYLGQGQGPNVVTDDGRRLAQIYGESDLLVMECLRAGIWADLPPAELAAACSTLVFESRGRATGDSLTPRIPAAIKATVEHTNAIWGRLAEMEAHHRLPITREPDPGFAWAAHRWASGATLRNVLSANDLTAGDFVRWTKQVIDVLGQIGAVAPGDQLGASAQQAVDRMRRGVVALR
jgi:ATP-dependent RNA helicase HelY